MSEEPEYEPLPRTGGWRIPVLVAAVALLALYGNQRFYGSDPPEPIAAATDRSGELPAALTDGSSPDPTPEVLTDRFRQPVLMARRLDAVPESVAQRCGRAYFADAEPGSRRAARHEALQDLVDEASALTVRMTPDGVTVLRVGRAATPPGFPRAYQWSCLAQPRQGELRAGRPYLGYVMNNVTSAHGPGRRRRATSVILGVPEQATWALHERAGWWLGYDVEGDARLQLSLPWDHQADAPLRVVFLDENGAVVDDRGFERAGTASLRWGRQRLDERIVVGPVNRVLDQLRERPLRRCSQDERLCVWITLQGNDVHAVAAFGGHRFDSPPFGFVGACPASGSLEGSTSDSRFALDGRWAEGPARRGLGRYHVSYIDGQVVVDLSRLEVGVPRNRMEEPATLEGPACNFGLDHVGRPA